MAGAPKFCSSCGNELTGAKKFCAECGHPVDAAAETTEPTLAAAPPPAAPGPAGTAARDKDLDESYWDYLSAAGSSRPVAPEPQKGIGAAVTLTALLWALLGWAVPRGMESAYALPSGSLTMSDVSLWFLLTVTLGLLPAAIAGRKGRPVMYWWFCGAALFIVALPAALLIDPAKPHKHASVAGRIVGLVLATVAVVAGTVALADNPTVLVAEAETAGQAASTLPSAPPRPTPPPPTSTGQVGSGVWQVGSDVQPGTYRTAGPTTPGGACYWARLSGFSGELDDLIANGNPTGPATVTISPTDAGFETTGCGPWTRTP